MTQPPDPNELDAAIGAVYRGPLEAFISRRDALAKELRAAKRREDAERVKALRKPSRVAWVLDNTLDEDPASIEQLAAAIDAAQSGTDVRTTLETIRAAIRTVAAAGARVAIRAGQPIEANALVTALHAVIGETSAFSDLRAGRLVEVPAGGGLDILGALPAIAPAPPSKSKPAPAPEPATTKRSVAATTRESELAKAAAVDGLRRAEAALEDLRRAEAALEDLRERSANAEQSVASAKEKLDAAERALVQAQAEAQTRRADLERARRDAEGVASQVRDAERSVAGARARVSKG